VLFGQLAWVFTAPSFTSFVTLAAGWMLCLGRHTISRVIQASGPLGRSKHHSAFYRFFQRSVWISDRVGKAVFQMALPYIPGAVYALVDDTLCRRTGPHIWGGAMHYDPLVSTYARTSSVGRHLAFAFGHNWVVLAVRVPLPWNPQRGVGLPVLLRLYRSKKRCPMAEYRKRTEMAVELVEIVAEWLPKGRRLIVVGDREYACKTLVRRLPPGVHFTGPMGMDARLYDLVPAGPKGRGRPRKRGPRLPPPSGGLEDPSLPWEKTNLCIYARKVPAWVKSRVALWYSVAGTRPVRIVWTRDPKGRIQDRAYFSTDLEATPEEILSGFSHRWGLEVTFFNTKQFLGLEDPQNGWGRRRAGRPSFPKRAGPQPRGRRGERAVQRTVPMVFVTYALIHLWYFQHGSPKEDVQTVRAMAPWYAHKREPSFADMLRAVRKEFWLARFSSDPQLQCVLQKNPNVLAEWLLAA